MPSMSGMATVRSTVPYGVAIAAAGVVILILKPLL
jgi:Flp pilus assembly protein protease CpaA